MKRTISRFVNAAAICKATRALGPGLRSVVWVQGCPFNCPGCLAPEWREDRKEKLFDPSSLAKELLAHNAVNGLTISGGEPFEQAEGLSETISLMKKQRDINVICFTGYSLKQLLAHPNRHSFIRLLRHVDLLIDGPYIKELDNGIGLRGSTNQDFHFISKKLIGFDYETMERSIEIQVQTDGILQVGIPSTEMVSAMGRTDLKLEALMQEVI